MKHLVLLACLLISGLVCSQNLQLHYDLGEDRSYPTVTIEMFKPDAWGSSFYFADFDLKSPANGKKDQINLAYFEFARGLKFWDAPFEYTVEYNGGITSGGPIANAYLTGPAYVWNAGDFSKGFTLKLLYKHIDNALNHSDASFQFTGVWYYFLPVGDMKLKFTGFLDLWKEKQNFFLNKLTAQGAPDGTTSDWIFLTEPQLWLEMTDHFAVGGEIEIGNNFALQHGFKINPTLGIKWKF